MPKRPHLPNGGRHSLGSSAGWSIGSNNLTPDGRSELLKSLGHQLRTHYDGILNEPTPDGLRSLLERLDQIDLEGDG